MQGNFLELTVSRSHLGKWAVRYGNGKSWRRGDASLLSVLRWWRRQAGHSSSASPTFSRHSLSSWMAKCSLLEMQLRAFGHIRAKAPTTLHIPLWSSRNTWEAPSISGSWRGRPWSMQSACTWLGPSSESRVSLAVVYIHTLPSVDQIDLIMHLVVHAAMHSRK